MEAKRASDIKIALTPKSPEEDLSASAADLVGEAFVRYHAEFKALTERAMERFEACDWHGLHHDTGRHRRGEKDQPPAPWPHQQRDDQAG